MEPVTITFLLGIGGFGLACLGLLYRKLNTDTAAAATLAASLATLTEKIEGVVHALKDLGHIAERTNDRVTTLEIEQAVQSTEIAGLKEKNNEST